MRRSILFNFVIITLVCGLVGGGLFADFSDIETSRDNYFATGSLDLTVSDYLGVEYNGDTIPAFFQQGDAWPCCSKERSFGLHNMGQGAQSDPYAYLHFKNLECVWVMPKDAYAWIDCVEDPVTGEMICVKVPAPIPEPDPGNQGSGLPKPVTEPEYVAECGGIAGEDRNGDPVVVPGVGCCFGENCNLARHVTVRISVAGPYPCDTVPTAADVPESDWRILDLSEYDDDPADSRIKMNELVCEQILLGQIPCCQKIWVNVVLHLQDIDEDDLIAQGVLTDSGTGYGWFDETNTIEAKWDHWPTNAIQQDGIHFDISFELLQTAELPRGDASPPAVTVLIPNGGEYWEGGSSYEITWTATDGQTPADQLVIAIDYSTDGGRTWNNIASGEANDGTYNWAVPNTIDTMDALVRVSAQDLAGNVGSDESDAVFTIDSTMPAVTVVYPTLNEIWFIGHTYEIKWIASDNFTPSNELYNIVEFCNDGRASTPTIWRRIGEGHLTDVSGNGSCTWRVDANPSNYCLIRVTARDLSGTNIGIGVSDYFCPVEP